MMISTTIRICPSRCLLLWLLAKMLYWNAYKYLWHTRAVFGDLYSVEKTGGLRFRCPGYFINHLVISIPPTHFKSEKNISNPEWFSTCATVPTATLLCLLCLMCLPCDCVPRWLTLPTLSYSVHPCPLYDHISLHHLLCVWPETGGGKGCVGQDQTQIWTLVKNGKHW